MRATDDVMTEAVFLGEIMDCWDGDERPDSFERGTVRVCAGEWRREQDARWRFYEFEDADLPPSRRKG